MGVEHFKNDCASVAEAQSCTAGMTSFRSMKIKTRSPGDDKGSSVRLE